MKIHKISLLMLSALTLAACNDIDDVLPESGTITAEQLSETTSALPERLDATFAGMFTMMGQPYAVFGTSSERADDFGFISAAISQDYEGADMVSNDNGYNWFSTALELSSRNADYANPYMRYTLPYRQIGVANDIINAVDLSVASDETKAQVGQAYAIIAFDYLSLAPYFQFTYAIAKDEPCVPIIADSLDATNNPRATVAQVYELIISKLNTAIELLEGYVRSDKTEIDQQVAYGLRARAYLEMCEYEKAAEDAAKAMEGYTPASMSDVSVPTFCDLAEENWMWGIDITDDMVSSYHYPTSPSWLCAFTGDGYGPYCDVVPCINKLLYDKIPSTDVRKGWWLDENSHSDNWASITWAGATGDEIASLIVEDSKLAEYGPYTNIKFALKSGAGSTINNNDWCLMRVEEMILLRAEALYKAGNTSAAQSAVETFVKTYRDPSYSFTAGGRDGLDEIWFQRRVELWGEGFFAADAKRLQKPIVRFHEGEDSNYPDAFMFNVAADDGWLNMRFTTSEMNTNFGIVDNTGGSIPVSGQNGELRDGVTD